MTGPSGSLGCDTTSSRPRAIVVVQISKPVLHVMSLLGKRYPRTYEEFLESRLPGTFEPERSGK